MVSIPACHAGNPGSIPGLGAFFYGLEFCISQVLFIRVARMAQWIRRLPTEQEIPGSSPGMGYFFVRSEPNYEFLNCCDSSVGRALD